MTGGVERRVTEQVAAGFGLRLVTLEQVTHGADQHARLWLARTADGDRYAVKMSGGGNPAGLVVAAYLADHQVPGIAAPLRTGDGRLFVEYDGARLSVVPWVSDRRALDGPMTEAHWRAYGELLAAVHAVPVTDELRRLLPAGGATYPSIVAAARATAARLCGPEPVGLADPLVVELAEVWSTVADRLVILGGVLAFAPISPEQQEAALAGYGPVDIDPVRLAWFLAVRALDDLTDWTRQALDPDADAVDRERAARIVRGLVSPVGLVTLADAAVSSRRAGRCRPVAGARGAREGSLPGTWPRRRG
ncbi:hypothetical protein O7634_23345 [Micromonospora sp. WMMD1120]|uniref:hypothetical protein n=1 Tax=Micromonospora sp. WMMD1120 TaxID=3016106 RepID=UPI002415DE5F|nr:hypothetical protein [Micromonospora sp. WMMD1120]MDG4809697.1 hypothetical protein [Micromonospora sp. WMMD1120]